MTEAATARVAYWDNARFVAIVLVVLGHALTKMVPESSVAFSAYLWIYAFHIPLFVALAGFFSRSEPLGSRQLYRLMTDLVAPYLIFEIIWSAIQSINQGAIVFNPLTPNWTLWFLLSLLAWRILLPFVAMVRWPMALALIVSVGSGYLPVDQTLSISRTLGFLPLFVFGWWAHSTVWPTRWREATGTLVIWVRVGATAFLIAIGALIFWAEPWLRAVGARRLLTFDQSYAEAGFEMWWAGALRLGVLALGVAMMLAILILIPRRTTWFSELGGATMSIYLLHTFAIAPLRSLGVLSGEPSWWLLALLVPGSVALSWLLGSAIVRRLTRPLISPTMSWIIRREKEPKP